MWGGDPDLKRVHIGQSYFSDIEACHTTTQ